MAASALAQDIDSVRRFNRFYTRQIGALQEKLLHSAFSLTEGRVLYEIGDTAIPARCARRRRRPSMSPRSWSSTAVI